MFATAAPMTVSSEQKQEHVNMKVYYKTFQAVEDLVRGCLEYVLLFFSERQPQRKVPFVL
jgi:hypothetical protein